MWLVSVAYMQLGLHNLLGRRRGRCRLATCPPRSPPPATHYRRLQQHALAMHACMHAQNTRGQGLLRTHPMHLPQSDPHHHCRRRCRPRPHPRPCRLRRAASWQRPLPPCAGCAASASAARRAGWGAWAGQRGDAESCQQMPPACTPPPLPPAPAAGRGGSPTAEPLPRPRCCCCPPGQPNPPPLHMGVQGLRGKRLEGCRQGAAGASRARPVCLGTRPHSRLGAAAARSSPDSSRRFLADPFTALAAGGRRRCRPKGARPSAAQQMSCAAACRELQRGARRAAPASPTCSLALAGRLGRLALLDQRIQRALLRLARRPRRQRRILLVAAAAARQVTAGRGEHALHGLAAAGHPPTQRAHPRKQVKRLPAGTLATAARRPHWVRLGLLPGLRRALRALLLAAQPLQLAWGQLLGFRVLCKRRVKDSVTYGRARWGQHAKQAAAARVRPVHTPS